MKKIICAVSTLAFAAATSTPAMAEVPPVIIVDTDLTPLEACIEQLRPNDPNSMFHVEAAITNVGEFVNVGEPYADDAVGDPYGVGTPTYTSVNAGASGGFYRNGGSPNVWGTAVANLTVYPQTGQLFNFYADQTRTTTFDCVVSKDPGGEDHGPGDIYPPGLQTTGNTAIEEMDHVFVETKEVVTEDDFVVPGAQNVNTLICISPNNTTKGKPGDWKKMHGFTGSCTDASNAAGTNFIPSNNDPLAD